MEQLSMDFGLSFYEFNKPIRLIELFGGIGTQAMALKRLGIPFEHYEVVEFDKYCIKSYNAIHGTNFNTKDIKEVKRLNIIDTDKYDYIVTYSFPCTDISIAGKGKGMAKGGDTRSGLLWEVERLLGTIEELPQVLLMENVPQIISKKHKPHFNLWQNYMANKGYSNHIFKLNAKDYNVAQNRDRVFMLSILGNYDYIVPKGMKLDKCLQDYLEDAVDEKYYLNDEQLKWAFGNALNKNLKDVYDREKAIINKEIAYTIATKPDRRVGDANFICDNIDGEITVSNYIKIPEATKQGYALAQDGDGVYINRPHQKRGVVQKQMIQTIKTHYSDVGVVTKELRIRKLTPLETWRLMGIKDEHFWKAKNTGVSDSQLYKQAGNAIVVDVLVAIFKNLIKREECETHD